MEREDLHQLTAAYALDALDPDEESAFEEHLSRCEPCREELADFRETTGLLPYAVAGPVPPPALRDRVLATARSERSGPGTVLPFRRRIALPVAGGLAAAAAAAAVVVGVWASSLHSDLARERSAQADTRRAISVLSNPLADQVPLTGGHGTLVVTPAGPAALVIGDLAPAPAGKVYEAWVAEDSGPLPAALFERGQTAVALTRPVRPGSAVMVTLEPEGGVPKPTGKIVLRAQGA